MLMQARASQAADMHRRPPGRGRSRERAVRARGRDTVARLLAAGLAECEERGFQPVTSSGVQLPRAELVDRLTAIVMAAFQAPEQPT